MNRTFTANPSKAGAWSRVLVLLGIETALLALFLYLGSQPVGQVDFGRFSQWVQASAPMDVVLALMITVGIFASLWLFVSTVLYMAAGLMHLSRVENGLRIFTLPVARRAIDAALAVSIAGTSLLGAGRAAFAAPPTREAAVTIQAAKAAPLARSEARPHIVVRTADAADEEAPTPAGAGDASEGPATPWVPPSAEAGNGNGASVVRPPGQGGAPAAPNQDAGSGGVVEEGEAPEPAGPGTTDPAPAPTPAPAPDPGPSPAGPGDADKTAGGGGAAVVRPGAPTGGATAQDPGDAPDPGGAGDVSEDPSVPTNAPSDGAGDVQVQGQAAQAGTYTVQSGDNFWTIAANHLQTTLGREPSNEEIRVYWVKLIEVNQANISSGNPSLIFPGETFVLPPL